MKQPPPSIAVRIGLWLLCRQKHSPQAIEISEVRGAGNELFARLAYRPATAADLQAYRMTSGQPGASCSPNPFATAAVRSTFQQILQESPAHSMLIKRACMSPRQRFLLRVQRMWERLTRR